MPYPDKLLADDEEVVAHLHPHWTTLFWPVVRFLLVVGAASYLAALVPAGRQQGVLRMVLLAVALVVLAVAVVRPVLRWRTTHVVLTTHRVLVREGVLTRRGRDVALSRVTDVSCRRTLWERVVRSGTVTVESAGDGPPLVLRRLPDSDGVQALLAQLVDDADPFGAVASEQHAPDGGGDPWGDVPSDDGGADASRAGGRSRRSSRRAARYDVSRY
ncbi:PH domain-containing protein [Geodermatophilus saharensis]|uniref:PH domain-containing protein n=1 Tax=Geodermatophilus saharensis TaxID=1137994 RepID=A0A238ZYE5_9ACTN|nr:PH domain-containing protein [Geodermatophilus saharensis]SNR87898.1 PH domain-containing protein [Geodermatophilus saharensis]